MATAELVKQDERALDIQEVASRIEAALQAGRKAMWELAESLHAFHEMRGWQKLGYRTVSQWLDDTNGAISRGTYYRLVGTWRAVVIEQGVEPERVRLLDQSKVAIVADKLGEKRVKVDNVLADVEALPANGLRKKYGRPARGRSPKAAERGGLATTALEAEVLPPAEENTPRTELRDRLVEFTSWLLTAEGEDATARALDERLATLEDVITEARFAAMFAAKQEEGA